MYIYYMQNGRAILCMHQCNAYIFDLVHPTICCSSCIVYVELGKALGGTEGPHLCCTAPWIWKEWGPWFPRLSCTIAANELNAKMELYFRDLGMDFGEMSRKYCTIPSLHTVHQLLTYKIILKAMDPILSKFKELYNTGEGLSYLLRQRCRDARSARLYIYDATAATDRRMDQTLESQLWMETTYVTIINKS